MPCEQAPAEVPAAEPVVPEPFAALPMVHKDDEEPPDEPPVGSRWNPRHGSRPSPEAPYGRSLIDLQATDRWTSLQPCWHSLRGKMSIKQFKENVDKQMPGRHYGIMFPHNFEQLRAAGKEWLTKALHTAGTLPRSNKVIDMEVVELSTDSMGEESMGGQGMKGLVKLQYQNPHPELHNELFIKMPFPYDPKNERTKNSYNYMPDDPEIFFNMLFGKTRAAFQDSKVLFRGHQLRNVQLYSHLGVLEVQEDLVAGRRTQHDNRTV